MKKKVLALFLSLLLTVGLITACDSGSTTSGGNQNDPVTLSMWIWDDAQSPAMKSMADAFTAQSPWITIEITSVAGVSEYNMKMQSVIGTADAPEIFWMNFNLAREYIPMGFVQDLTELIDGNGDNSVDITTLNNGITAAYTVDGKVYAIPKDTDSYGIYYNKALFDAADVDYPDGSWTIEEFAATAEKLTKDGVVGWTNSQSDRVYYNFLTSNGAQIYSDDGTEATVNSPEAVEAMQILFDLMNGGYAYTGSQLAEMSDSAAFTSGLAAITINGSWMISQYSEALGDNLGITELPSGKKGKASAGHGIGYATTTSNAHKDATMLFMAYLATEEAQEMQVEVVIPASNNAANKWESVYPDLNVNAFVKALDYSFPIPLAATNPTRTRTTFQEHLANFLAGEYNSAQEALDATKAAMDAAINN